MTQLVFVRHAQTVANVEGHWTGWQTTELTERGRAQARATARRLKDEAQAVVALYTSPLPRARETARVIGRALGLEPRMVDGLREINFGHLDGVSLEEMEARYPDLHASWRDRSDVDYAWPGGERRGDFFQRVVAACDQIVDRHPQGTVIVVAHGGTIRAALAHFLPQELGEWWNYPLGNCSISRVSIGPEGPRRITLNDRAHLPPG
jgi:broad specificity phosphatase PhoE